MSTFKTWTFCCRMFGCVVVVLIVSASIGTVSSLSPPQQQPQNNHNSLFKASTALIAAGELTSDMASKLPNWYSSKEGLTGESPAVFGGCGMALIQAGTSLQEALVTEQDIVGVSLLRASFQNCASDLASAACALDPIGIGEPMDRACGAMEDWASNLIIVVEDDSNNSDQTIQASCQKELCEALLDCETSFCEYGDLLLAEDSKQGESAAGSILARAGFQLGQAARAFGEIVITQPY